MSQNFTWKIDELKILCNNFDRHIPEILFQTIHWKIFQINYHKEEIKNILIKYKTKGFNSNDPNLDSDWNKATAHFVAFSHAYVTIPDILLHIINYAYFDNPLKSENVKFNSIIKKLKSNFPNANVLIEFDKFYQNKKITYIRSFINTEKHHHLVDMKFRIIADVNNGVRDGFQIKAFNSFGEKWLNEIIEEYPETLLELVSKLGISINQDIKTELCNKKL